MVGYHWRKDSHFAEMDVLSLHEVGFSYAVSLPDGAPKTAKFDENDKRFQALQNCDWLQEAEGHNRR